MASKDPKPMNLSAPGAPWGGQSTIWDAYRDLLLSEKGRFLQSTSRKPRRNFREVPECTRQGDREIQRPGLAVPKNATLRRFPQWPAPTFDSSAFCEQQVDWQPQPPPATPCAELRLEGDGEVQRSNQPLRPASEDDMRVEPTSLPLELKWSGVRHFDWSRPRSAGFVASSFAQEVAIASRANSDSPRYAPLRYGAAIVRQQRGTAAMGASSQQADARRPRTAGQGQMSMRSLHGLARGQQQQASMRPQVGKVAEVRPEGSATPKEPSKLSEVSDQRP
eukprot:TRINITY_DN84198_c0_g1_i1.p1 TRINITY_DN84198_c0_g1~~TRINITY_DN84198_c0_g1_i1.p1  ORF type:complete len:278 (+),score=49.68 TRINITY_DN84198_c0_g1_i1:33-866(+)